MRRRKQEIDICKGILTVTMILCHCIQFFGVEDSGLQKILVNVINVTTFSGFVFCFGYVSHLAYYQNEWKKSAWKMGQNAIRILLAFYISGLSYVVFVEQKIFRWDFVMEVLLLKKYPGWSEFLASFAAILLIGILVYPVMKRMNGWILIICILVSAGFCFFPYEHVHNSWLALLVGSREFVTFPVVQYWGYFAMGVWMSKRQTMWSPLIFTGCILAGVPCIGKFVIEGRLPERFPPSLSFIGGGCIFVYVYFLLARWLEQNWTKNKITELSILYLEQVGKNSLYYLLMSNIFIFALDGSNFSFHSEAYAYIFFTIVLLLIAYLDRLRIKEKRNAMEG
ncbi:MAG: heparan-alpha-glucosaminide N-acetyltransferase domain-containing protein [Blautia sp.]